MEIAALLHGRGTAEWRSRLVAHLGECPECLELVQACSGRLRESEETEGMDENRAARAGLAAPDEREFAGWPPVLRLHVAEPDELDDEVEVMSPWAAAPADPEFPVLISADGTVRVRFRRPRPDAPLRAYVIAPSGSIPPGIALLVRDPRTTIPLGPDGTADLPGISIDDVRSGAIVLELHRLQADAAED